MSAELDLPEFMPCATCPDPSKAIASYAKSLLTMESMSSALTAIGSEAAIVFMPYCTGTRKSLFLRHQRCRVAEATNHLPTSSVPSDSGTSNIIEAQSHSGINAMVEQPLGTLACSQLTIVPERTNADQVIE